MGNSDASIDQSCRHAFLHCVLGMPDLTACRFPRHQTVVIGCADARAAVPWDPAHSTEARQARRACSALLRTVACSTFSWSFFEAGDELCFWLVVRLFDRSRVFTSMLWTCNTMRVVLYLML